MSDFKEVHNASHIEDREKNLFTPTSDVSQLDANAQHHLQRGIDSEVANFFAQEEGERIVIDEAENKRLRTMVHKRVLIVMVVTYFAQTLDKGTLNFASIMGIRKDTNLVGQQYSWLTTCLYIAVLVWEFPTNRLIQRLPIAKYLGANIIIWGIILACHATAKNFTVLVTLRTLLGLFETVCQPAFVYLSTMWYTRAEQPLIIGSFYSMNGFQQCVGGLLAYGISQYTTGAIKNWQFLFTLLGCCTVVWGCFVLWWLPDSPMRATCWSERDRLLIAERVRQNQTGIQNREFKWYQVREALRDTLIWGITLVSFTNALPTGGLGAFSNIILNEFGFTVLQTYLLAIAQGAIIMILLFSAAFLSKRYSQRLLCAVAFTLPNIAGTIVFLTVKPNAHTKVGMLLAFYCTQGFGAVAVLNLAVMSGNIAGRTKQVVSNTLVFVAWAVGNAIGPQVFQDKEKPRYIGAFTAHIIMYAVQVTTLLLMRVLLMRRNAVRRAKALAEGKEADTGVDRAKNAFSDLTDFENPDFRYVY
ncbi:MFS general substrate transporter [Auriculariales sp. MPI-PUGE-AT-0066]|nr:MFS general substrate transporter [Auriculariales sp. MPI-PUGE-AT-0066]